MFFWSKPVVSDVVSSLILGNVIFFRSFEENHELSFSGGLFLRMKCQPPRGLFVHIFRPWKSWDVARTVGPNLYVSFVAT